MPGPIARYLLEDHARLDALLGAALADPARVAREPYDRFRKGLLRHIGIEEKLLIPAARKAQGGAPIPGSGVLRADHGRLTALLVPTPTPAILGEIREILQRHNALEEGPGGVYELCEGLLGAEAEALAARIAASPEVPVRPNQDGRLPLVLAGGQ